MDDATSEVSYGEFFETENLNGYIAVLRRIIQLKGVPRVVYVDHVSWLSGTTKTDEAGQFKRICEELGMIPLFANSPQVKGRIERLWQTLQDRLSAELNDYGVQEIQPANIYLNRIFLPQIWNQKFTVVPQSAESSYLAAPSEKALREILCYKYIRKIRYDHTVLWGNRTYKITAHLAYSIAKKECKIREYSTGLIKGYLGSQRS